MKQKPMTALYLGGCISLLMPRLPWLPSQYYSNVPGNLGNLGSNKEIQQIPKLCMYLADLIKYLNQE